MIWTGLLFHRQWPQYKTDYDLKKGEKKKKTVTGTVIGKIKLY